VRLCLALGHADGDAILFRPCGIRFHHADRDAVKTVTLTWPTPPHSAYITCRRSAPYRGEGIDYF
jgi:hypothetical protein